LFSDSAWHGRSNAEGETVIVAVDNGLDKRADRRLLAPPPLHASGVHTSAD
jgi:hypothetical protein